MANFNQVILLGNLTRDPQLSYLPSQVAACEFGLAVNRKWKKDGQTHEEVCFVDCVCFGKQAETFNQYMTKGQSVLVEGRLKFESWEQGGQKRSKHRVVVETFQFLGGKPKQQTAPAHQPPAGNDIPF